MTLAFVTVAAGVLSFASPCCLPLVPGYLSYVSAVPVTGLSERASRWAVLRASLLFVTGFTIVFTAFRPLQRNMVGWGWPNALIVPRNARWM